jgi:hypothetical protein
LEWVLEKHPFRHSWFTSEESKHPGKEDEAPSIASNSNDHDLKKETEFLKDHVMRLSKELRIQQNQQHSEAGSPKIESKFDILELPQDVGLFRSCRLFSLRTIHEFESLHRLLNNKVK